MEGAQTVFFCCFFCDLEYFPRSQTPFLAQSLTSSYTKAGRETVKPEKAKILWNNVSTQVLFSRSCYLFAKKKKKTAHNQPQQLPFPSHPFIVCFAKFEIGGMENAAKTRELCLSKRAYHSHHTFLIRTLLEFKMLNWDSQVFKGEEGADSAVGDKWNVSDVPLPTPLQEDFT